jgi:hypothetical protein
MKKQATATGLIIVLLLSLTQNVQSGPLSNRHVPAAPSEHTINDNTAGGLLATAVGGAGLGAAVGTIIPVVGTGIGAVAGAVVMTTIQLTKPSETPDRVSTNDFQTYGGSVDENNKRQSTDSLSAQQSKLESGKFDRRSITLIAVTGNSTASYQDAYMFAAANSVAESRYDVNNATQESLKGLAGAINANASLINNDSMLIDAIRNSRLLSEVIQTTSNTDSLEARIARQKQRKDVSAKANENISGVTGAQMTTLINGTHLVVVSLDSTKKSAKDLTFYGTVVVVACNADTVSNWIEGRYPDPKQLGLSVIGRKSIQANDADLEGSLSALNNSVSNFGNKDAQAAPKKPANETASNNLITKAFDYLSGLDAFKVRAMVQNYDNGIDAGNREGVYTDMGFKVYETRLDSKGKPYSEYIGFGRANSIGDNKADYNNYSTIYPKIGSFDQGMIAVAHEQGIVLSLQPYYRTVTVAREIPAIFGNDPWGTDANSAFGLLINAHYNLAPLTKIPQLYAGINVGFSWVNAPTAISTTNNWTISPPYVVDVNLNVTKKLDFGRMAAIAGLDVGLSTVSFSAAYSASDLTANVAVGSNYCIGLNTGLEYQLTPDVLLAAVVSYRQQLTGVDDIAIKYSDGREEKYLQTDNEQFWSAYRLDEVNLGGLGLGLRVSYALPKLF